MKTKTRIILLSIIGILIIITIVLGVTYAFMRPVEESSSITSVDIKSCAKITLTDTGQSINLSNTYPMSKNKALQTTPYTFTVSSTCESYVGFNLYLATLNTNTIDASNIHYIITNNGSKEILSEGILSDATNALSDFNSDEQEQLNNGINGTFSNVYKIYVGNIPYQGEASYDLYLYVDGEVTDVSTMGKTFAAGVAVKAVDREADPTLAEYIINNVYTSDGENGLYYHNTTNNIYEAGDNSYRYQGGNPNNYVCFGSDEAICSNDNLYRIIGLFDNDDDGTYNIKLIKYDYAISEMLGTDGDYYGIYSYNHGNYLGNTSLNTIASYRWNGETNVGSNNWATSDFNQINLNTNYLNYLNNLDSKWVEMIATATWYLDGTAGTTLLNAHEFFISEHTSSVVTTYEAKIGLMYVSDYGYAVSREYLTYELDEYNNTALRTYNWMFMGLTEWTITSIASSSTNVFRLYDGGRLTTSSTFDGFAVRPCFYLKSNVVLSSGIGTKDDPYRLSE